MSTAGDLLDCLAEVGAKIEAAGNRLIVRAGPKPVPGELVHRLREAKAEVLAALTPIGHTPAAADAAYPFKPSEIEWWRQHFIVRTIDRKLGGARSPTEAAWLAWGELECRWHRLYGERLSEWLCAGCGTPIGGLPSLDLQDGNCVHLERLDCLIRYGERWRAAATQALVAMGLRPPAAGAP